MNKHNAKDYLPLVQALAEGRVIQFGIAGDWTDLEEPDFNRPPALYRIKPEPRKAWVWWPSEPNDKCYKPKLYETKDAACSAVRYTGGHITEVTE